jgi:polyprenyl-phospho-N-acetylgalactosaminyl synthase
MIEKSEILIIIPAYNEGSVIGAVISDLKEQGFSHILVVDDGSSDDTALIAKKEARVISHLINRGAGAAAQSGIAYARQFGFNYLIQIDGDGQHYTEDSEKLIAEMSRGQSDIVIGSRFLESSHSIPQRRIFYNKVSNIFTNWFCIGNFTDSQSGFRILNRRAIEQLNLTLDGFGYCSEMIFIAEKCGLRISEVPIRVRYTDYSLSKGQSFSNGIDTALHLLYKFFLHK